MLWHAMPPELNTARLMAGAGPAPMLQAAAGWEALAAALEVQADELAAILASLGAAWTGASSERAIAAAVPMIAWMKIVAVQAQKRGMQAAAQAAAYTTALAITPSLPEIAANHITRAVLVATNIFGINMVPIGLKETDYFVRMWNQAAGAMDAYQAETAANTVFEPLPPMKPIVLPDAGQAAEAGTISLLTQMAATAADPHALAALASQVMASADAEKAMAYAQQAMPFLTQIGQLGGQLQQLTSLVQSATGMGGGVGGGERAANEAIPQMGLIGAAPLSTHPLAGGSGPSVGAGLMRADALPGLAASASRTPLLGQLLDAATGSVAPASAVAGAVSGAGSSTAGGAAPLGGMAGHGGAQAGVVRALAAPAMFAAQSDDSEQNGRESYDDEDDW
ncbi:PPE family protein [Mycolicibacterium sphagni]|uniref:PPE family protein n=1 Tax=Mycolicibacterium sphagni TaxID=1786 RepID=A0ABX2JZ00_9MYCO|nr:PPE family protein [Mycolicibacterium sphagni]NTY60695.1 PPE family protein [Mycolicibacterium sphagni]